MHSYPLDKNNISQVHFFTRLIVRTTTLYLILLIIHYPRLPAIIEHIDDFASNPFTCDHRRYRWLRKYDSLKRVGEVHNICGCRRVCIGWTWCGCRVTALSNYVIQFNPAISDPIKYTIFWPNYRFPTNSRSIKSDSSSEK